MCRMQYGSGVLGRIASSPWITSPPPQIARQRPRDLHKPLRVHMIGEEGVDAGGVKKEFFQLFIAALLDPNYSLFVYQPETRTYW